MILDAVFRHVDIHGPLDPPLVVFLDEVGNAPLARLPEYLSTLASSGVLIVTVWQDVAQIKAAYGDNYGSILSNSRHVLVFGASKDPATLEWVKQVLGDEGASTLSRTSNVGELFGGSVSSSEQRVALTPANVLREMPQDRALLISANNLPAEVRHIPEHTVRAFEPLRRWPHPPRSTIGLPIPTGASDAETTGADPVDPAALLAGVFDSPFARVIGQVRALTDRWQEHPTRWRRPSGTGGSTGSSPGRPFAARHPRAAPSSKPTPWAGAGPGEPAPVDPLAPVEDRRRHELGEARRRPVPRDRAEGAGLVPVDSDGVEDLAGYR